MSTQRSIQMSISHRLRLLLLSLSLTSAAVAQLVSAPEPQTGVIAGTVVDVDGGIIPGAAIALTGPSVADTQNVVTGDNGFFRLEHLRAAVPYHLTISASGFGDWNSPELILKPGQFIDLTGTQLRVAVAVTSVTAVVPTQEIAEEQLNEELKQRVFGFIPNFYVTYDHNAAPLTPKQKYKLATRVMIDPVTFIGAAFLAGVDQAADNPDYVQGAKGFGQRMGANYLNGLTDIMIGGAVLPSILHQDPRYFYQGTGTRKSRTFHALSNPFICKGDNGRYQPNYSSLGGYLAAGALANTYYPDSNRGVGLVFSTAGVDVLANMANSVIQEFILRKLTPSAKGKQ
jgi:Carboxypeptidase regulatory-like domain